MCRLGAIELTKTYTLLDKKYPGYIKVFGFGPDDLGLDEFKSLNIFTQPIFVPVEGFDFYKIFQFKKPGFLKCYGFCNKGILKRTDDLKKVDYNAGYTFAGDLAQLGGSFIVNKKGVAVYSKLDNFLGDHATQDEIIYQFDLLLRYREFENVEQREESLEKSESNEDSNISKDSKESNNNISNKEEKNEIDEKTENKKKKDTINVNKIEINEKKKVSENENEVIKIKQKSIDNTKDTKKEEKNDELVIEGNINSNVDSKKKSNFKPNTYTNNTNTNTKSNFNTNSDVKVKTNQAAELKSSDKIIDFPENISIIKKETETSKNINIDFENKSSNNS